jgi:hypothetical protein
MKTRILKAILEGIQENPAKAMTDLAELGVPRGAIDQLLTMDPTRALECAQQAITRVDVHHATLAQLPCEVHLLAQYLQHGAGNDLIVELLGLTRRQVSLQRAALGADAAPGRPATLDDATARAAQAMWQTLSTVPRAQRLLLLHTRWPMYTLASLYAAVRG